MKTLMCLLVFCLSFLGFAQTSDILPLPFVPQKKWAICIGASKYKHIGQLRYASKDSIDFANTLKKDLGFSEDSVEILADEEGYSAPNASNMNQSLDRLLANNALNSGDLFIVYFSGHGAGLPSGDYWLPTDADTPNFSEVGISVVGVIERLVAKKLRNVVIISDACRAGSATPFGRSLIELGRKSNIAVILGCEPGQKSYEAPRFKQGAFTHFLMRSIQTRSAVDKVFGSLRVSQLGKTVALSVEKYTERDYGINAQKPFVSAGEQEDVVLGAYPQKTFLDSKDENIKASLSADKYRDYLLLLAAGYFEKDELDQALEALRTLRSLGESRPYFRYIYSATLLRTDRLIELRKYLPELTAVATPTECEWLVRMSCPADFIGSAEVSKAALALADTSFGTENYPLLDIAVSRIDDPQPRKSLFEKFANKFPRGSANDVYRNAVASLFEGKIEELEKQIANYNDIAGSAKVESQANRVLYKAYFETRQFDKARSLADRMSAKYPKENFWQIKALLLAVISGNSNLETRINEIVSQKVSGTTLYSMALVLGPDCAKYLAAFDEGIKNNPSDIGAHAASWIAHSMALIQSQTRNQYKGLPEFSDEMLKCADSQLDARQRSYEGLLSGLERVDKTPVTRDAYLEMADDLSDRFEEVQRSPESCLLLAQLMNRCSSHRLAMLYVGGAWENKHLELGHLAGQFNHEIFVAVSNLGLRLLTDTVYDRMKTARQLDEATKLRRVYSKISVNKLAEAESILSEVNRPKLSGATKTLCDIVATHLKIAQGDLKALDGFLEGLTETTSLNSSLVFYIEYLKHLRTDKLPSKRLLENVMLVDELHHDLWADALVLILRNASQRDSAAALEIREKLPFWSMDEPFNMNLNTVFYEGGDTLAAYDGHYVFNGHFKYGGTQQSGKVTYDVKAGKISGKIEIKGETGLISFNGTVSRYGKANIDLDMGGKAGLGVFVVVPNKFYQAMKPEEEVRTRLSIVSTSPFHLGFVCTTKSP